MTTSVWLDIDSNRDVIANVRHALHCIELAKSDPYAWKWAFLALHAALQGACVCHLTTTATPIGVTNEKDTLVWLNYLEASRTTPALKPPKTRIMAFPDLLRALRDGKAGNRPSGGNTFNLSDDEFSYLKRLHDEIRNQFIHFAPASWSIDFSGVNTFASLTSRIISDIMDYGWAFRLMDPDEKTELRDSLIILARL
ncbi:MAG TPA: hypothetical protein PLH11_11270 [Gemmobacter sp.]|nr:hypothetical protein [Gemmobacter sp.]